EEFGPRLRAFFHIKDPLLPGIVVGKSAAMAYGGPVLKQELDRMGLDPKDVVITDLDSDFRVHREYFSCITYRYVLDPGRLERIYQPIPLFHNNLWRVPTAIRVMASACTRYPSFLPSRPDRLVCCSRPSKSHEPVVRVGSLDDYVIPRASP